MTAQGSDVSTHSRFARYGPSRPERERQSAALTSSVVTSGSWQLPRADEGGAYLASPYRVLHGVSRLADAVRRGDVDACIEIGSSADVRT